MELKNLLSAFFAITAVLYAVYSGSAVSSHTKAEILLDWIKLEIKYERKTNEEVLR
jgi:hypothetical protein